MSQISGKHLFYLIFVVIIGLACENDLAQVEALIAEEDAQTETATNIEMLYSDSAKIRVQVKSPVLRRLLDQSTPMEEFPEGLNVKFYGANGIVNSHLTAQYAIRDEQKQKITVQDSVVWQGPKGELLEGKELVWDEKDQVVYSNKFVKITRQNGEIIYGYGFRSNEDFTIWKINAINGDIVVEGLDD